MSYMTSEQLSIIFLFNVNKEQLLHYQVWSVLALYSSWLAM